MCRLTKAVLDAWDLGDPYMLFQISVSGESQILSCPWRHYKSVGGIIVDAGVHPPSPLF